MRPQLASLLSFFCLLLLLAASLFLDGLSSASWSVCVMSGDTAAERPEDKLAPETPGAAPSSSYLCMEGKHRR